MALASTRDGLLANALPPVRSSDFSIGIICALPIELAAARSMLDVELPIQPKLSHDDNVYCFGRIGEHNVVVACLPFGVTGTNSAAHVSTQLRLSFPSVKFGLMVGIAGGAPSDKHDIRLGDIIVSKPTGSHGGIVQYDFGKTVQNAAFKITGQLNRPPNVLLSAVSHLYSKHILQNHSIRHHLTQAIGKYPQVERDCRYPGEDQDTLYEPGYDHVREDADCGACDIARTVARSPRPNSLPVIHYGLIASANQVMRHGLTRARLSKETDVLAFEMEAAGLMDSFPCLVVRGVCDYADSHKHKQWQPYAAFVAAAYAKELLQVIPHMAVYDTKPIGDQIEDAVRLVPFPQDLQYKAPRWQVPREAWDLTQSDSQIWATLLKRLSDYDPAKAHRRLRGARLESTCKWFLDHPTLRRWLEQSGPDSKSLWCSGTVGAGKTVLCTSLVDTLFDHCVKTGHMLSYYYCEISSQQTLQAVNLFRSLVKQMLDAMAAAGLPCPPSVALQLRYFFSPTGPSPDLQDIIHIFSLLFKHCPNAIIVIDGFDELEEQCIGPVLSALQDLMVDNEPGPMLLIASRDKLHLNLTPKFQLHIQVESSSTENDIKNYIDAVIAKKTTFERPLTSDLQILELIKSKLTQEAHGMFLWVKLQIEALWLDCIRDEQILQALEQLPKDLPSTYDRCMARLPRITRDISKRVLRWICCAIRPLHIQELQEAVSFDENDRTWDASKLIQPGILISSAMNLVVVDESDHTVRFTPPSFQQYLFQKSSQEPGRQFIVKEVDTLLCGQECISYLQFSNFTTQLQKHSSSTTVIDMPSPAAVIGSTPMQGLLRPLSRLLQLKANSNNVSVPVVRSIAPPQNQFQESQFAFLAYARDNWAYHTRKIETDSPLWPKFQKLALQMDHVWRLHPWTLGGQSYNSHLHGLLMWAAREGHEPLIDVVLSLGKGKLFPGFWDSPSIPDGLSALHIAARQGHHVITAKLLKKCQVDTASPGGRNALHFASEKGHYAILTQLLDVSSLSNASKLSNVVKQDKEGKSPLYLAAQQNHKNVAYLLLRCGADFELNNASSLNPIIIATVHGNYGIVRLFATLGGASLFPEEDFREKAVQIFYDEFWTPSVEAIGVRYRLSGLLDPHRALRIPDTIWDRCLEIAFSARHTKLVDFFLGDNELLVTVPAVRHSSLQMLVFPTCHPVPRHVVYGLYHGVATQSSPPSLNEIFSLACKGNHDDLRKVLIGRIETIHWVDDSGMRPVYYLVLNQNLALLNLCLQHLELDIFLPDCSEHSAFWEAMVKLRPRPNYSKEEFESVLTSFFARPDSEDQTGSGFFSAIIVLAFASQVEDIESQVVDAISECQLYANQAKLLWFWAMEHDLSWLTAKLFTDSIWNIDQRTVGPSLLYKVVQHGWIKTTLKILNREKKWLPIASGGHRALLMEAMQDRHGSLMQTLATKLNIAPAQYFDDRFNCALYIAIDKQDVEAVKIHLSHDNVQTCTIDSRARHSELVPLLHHAIRIGESAVIRLLLADGRFSVNQLDQFGYTPLHAAIAYIPKQFQAGGAQYDYLYNINGFEPSAGIVRSILLVHEIDIDIESADGSTALDLAIQRDHGEIVSILMSCRRFGPAPKIHDSSPLLTAVRLHCFKAASSILKADPSAINEYADKGQTLLIIATRGGHTELAACLLRFYPNKINAIDKFGATLLFDAVSARQISIVEMLLGRDDVDVNLRAYNGHSPVYEAAFHGYTDIAILLMRDNRCTLTDSLGRNLLHEAAVRGHTEVVGFLAAFLLPVGMADLHHVTLDPPSHTQHFRLASLLKNLGVSPLLRDTSGRLPVDIAKKAGNRKMVAALERYRERYEST